MTNEITGGDVRNAEEVTETAGVGAFTDAGTTQENPLNIPIFTRRRVRISGRESTC